MARGDPTIYMKLPMELKEQLDSAAHDNRRSLTAEVAARLSASFNPPPTAAPAAADLARAQKEMEWLRITAHLLAAQFDSLTRRMPEELRDTFAYGAGSVLVDVIRKGTADDQRTAFSGILGKLLDSDDVQWALQASPAVKAVIGSLAAGESIENAVAYAEGLSAGREGGPQASVPPPPDFDKEREQPTGWVDRDGKPVRPNLGRFVPSKKRP